MDADAVLFDLDRTLCVLDQDFDAVVAESFATVGVEPYCDAGDIEAVIDDVSAAESDREFFELCFAAAARRADADPGNARALGRAYVDLLDFSRVSFQPGAEAALAAARDGYDVGLVTNGGRETQTEKLAALGIDDAFDVAVFATPEEGIKPDPYPFERALSALAVDPERAAMVGDSLASDVAGANRLGMRSVWVPFDAETADHSAHDPTHVVESLRAVPSLL